MVDLLLGKGMVERRRGGSDRRIVIISPTALGERVAAEVIEDAMSIIRGAFENDQQRGRDEIIALLGRMEEARSGYVRLIQRTGVRA